MKIDIGNILPHTNIKIRFIYSEELEVSVNKFWKYKVPSTITPRYCNDRSDLNAEDTKLITSMPSINSSSHKAYTWSFLINIKSNSTLTFLKSTTHNLIVLSTNDLQTEAVCTVDSDNHVMKPN